MKFSGSVCLHCTLFSLSHGLPRYRVCQCQHFILHVCSNQRFDSLPFRLKAVFISWQALPTLMVLWCGGRRVWIEVFHGDFFPNGGFILVDARAALFRTHIGPARSETVDFPGDPVYRPRHDALKKIEPDAVPPFPVRCSIAGALSISE